MYCPSRRSIARSVWPTSTKRPISLNPRRPLPTSHHQPPTTHAKIYLIRTEERCLLSSPKEPEQPKKTKSSYSRRGFLAGMGVTRGVLTTGILEQQSEAAPAAHVLA